MSLEERIYSVLIVSASESFTSSISALLPESKYTPICIVSSVQAARKTFAERPFDFVILNAPLPDDIGTRFAMDACNEKGTVVLMMARAEIYAAVVEKTTAYGVFSLQKPTSRPTVMTALNWMASARERLRKTEKKTFSLEEKMEEIRLVNRAKWILIREKKMEEPEAHRYIEKQAMDRCISRREVAEEIIYSQ